MIKSFRNFNQINESFSRFDAGTITNKDGSQENWLDKASQSELDRILIAWNDGQGDTYVYDWRKLVRYSKDFPGWDENMSNREILEFFYDSLELNGNMTEIVYFDIDENRYKSFNW